MTLSMLWHLRQVNEGWCKAMGETIAWNALELVKINNQVHHKFVAMHGFKRCFLHECLQIEIDYLREFLGWYDTLESFENVESNVNSDFSFFSLRLLI
jgi:hypothetical protein